MSKRTSYGKIYRPDVHFVWTSVDIVRTSACVRIYPADGFLPSTPRVQNASPRTRPYVHADELALVHMEHQEEIQNV
jgi:hypothetical protein